MSRFKKYVDPDEEENEPEPEGPGLSGLPPPKISMKFNRYDSDEEEEEDLGGSGLSALPPPRVSIPRRYDPDDYSEDESEDYDYYDDDEFQVGQKRRRNIISIYAPNLTACS